MCNCIIIRASLRLPVTCSRGFAREYLHRAQAGIGALGDDQYGQLIKGGLDRLTQQLTPR
ncbi:hypothetical protein [Micromonospora sp. NBC_00860]|uniref:hypothetical protein n=1 Tax=Micromonospora sp. NBC_00860 TaxID=2975980 RepID=UPI003868F2D2|nr:hypothetical protein OH804_06435 [Micromonospora sp. NBC_00860]